MIQSKQDYREYLAADAARLSSPVNLRDWLFHKEKYYVWKFLKSLRKQEYLMNVKKGGIGKLVLQLHSIFFYRLMHKTQLYIYPNVCGPGLSIPHLGYLLISAQAEIGKNCTIRPGTLIASNLGSTNTKLRKVVVGDDVEFSAGCKILCKKIGNNVSVGPNAVVSKNVPDNSIVMGNPAEIVPKVVF